VVVREHRRLRADVLLQSDAPLYYYSFTDASIAMAYKSLTKEQQARSIR
jgi:hypothetical protein